jgi:hypothetical protein
MLLGALLGGVLGERWHSKLTRRAVSGKYRPGRDDQPAERDQEGPGHDQRDRSTDHSDDTGATRLTSSATRRPQPNGSAGHATTASSDPPLANCWNLLYDQPRGTYWEGRQARPSQYCWTGEPSAPGRIPDPERLVHHHAE